MARFMASLSTSRVVAWLFGFVVGVLFVSFVLSPLSTSSVRNYCSLQQLDLDARDDSEGHNTITSFMQRLVTVTAISDNHLNESQDMLRSVKRCLPNNKVIVYDLGLSDTSKRRIEELYKNVEIRPFPFWNYENLPHVRNLLVYAWKPILIKEVSLEHDVIMYGDSSMRMKSCDLKKALAHLLYFPIFGAVGLHHIAIEFTHDGMIEYLQYPKNRKDLAHMYSIEATGFLLWANAMMKEILIDPWLDCALHEECIAPPGAALWPCHFANNNEGRYAGCHRYDQSALDIILAREFGATSAQKANNEAVRKPIWRFKREINAINDLQHN